MERGAGRKLRQSKRDSLTTSLLKGYDKKNCAQPGHKFIKIGVVTVNLTSKCPRSGLRTAALLLALLLLSACGRQAEEPPEEPETPSPTVSESPSPSPSESEPEPTPTGPANPLTGEVMEGANVKARPVAVMFNNITAALPQQGNSGADIIYEVVAEGGITRMLGVFQSLDGVDIVGSVRSSRPYFVELAMGLDAVYVHAGGSEDAYSCMSSWSTDHMDGVRGVYSGNGLFWRSRDRIAGKSYAAEHSLVTSGESIQKYLAESGFRLEHEADWTSPMSFTGDGTPEGGSDAKTVMVSHYGNKATLFRYDEASKKYLVEEYGGAYIDGNTGEQIAVTNVLALRARMADMRDGYNHVAVSLDKGDGWFACGGKSIPITWEKGAYSDPLTYYTQDGKPLVLGQGKTYVNIIPQTAEVTCE